MEYEQRHRAEELARDYQAGALSRRSFLRRLALVTGSLPLAVALAESLGCGSAAPEGPPSEAQPPPPPAPALGPGVTVAPDDPALEAATVEFRSDGVTLFAYRARPRPQGTYPTLLVIHENRGLVPHIQDVSRRLAREGYVALAIDLVSREGGTARFQDPAEVIALLGQAPRERLVEDMNAGVRYLQGLPYVRRDRVGATGFCFGGGMVWLLAARNPEIRAAVPFYGPAPPLEEVPNLRAAVLGLYGGDDARINAGVPDLEAALQRHSKTYKLITYPGANHAFFNDTTQRYHPEAATAAWQETLAWLTRYLKG